MQKTLRYLFSVFVVSLISSGIYSQTYRIKGLRLGTDISRFSLYYFDPARKAYEFSADFEIRRDLYLTGEYGMQTVSFDKNIYKYNSEGNYFRIGIDHNFLKSERPEEYEMTFIGIRYGYSRMKHSADSIIIPENYWGGITDLNIPESVYNAHWVEFVAGIRAELFQNFFLGWSLRARILLAHTKNQYMEPYNIPGYGNGSKKGNFGFNFSVYYRIPLYKKDVNYKPIKK
jgi:hypothetical protein